MSRTHRALESLIGHLPPRLRTSPLASLAVLMWVAVALQLFTEPWPTNLWPTEGFPISEDAYTAAYYGMSVIMALAGIVFLVGEWAMHPHRRVPSFLRWLALWVLLGASVTIFMADLFLLVIDQYFVPDIFFSMVAWAGFSLCFSLSLRAEWHYHKAYEVIRRDS